MTNPVTNPDLASQFPWAQVVSFVVALLGVIASRLIDRYLPDPNGANPLPQPPPVAYSEAVSPAAVVTQANLDLMADRIKAGIDNTATGILATRTDDDGEPAGRHVAKKDDLE